MTADGGKAPRISVVVRSFNRVPWLCELVRALLAMDHASFEVVVVEQSTNVPADAAAELAELERDPRLRVLRSRPLGGARARNVGAAAARGDLLVFIDDDDLPSGDDFLRTIEARFDADPSCLGLSVRQYWREGEVMPWRYRVTAPIRCMRFSRLLRLPRTYVRHDAPVDRVDYVHGTGGALRREVLTRFGGWDEDTPIEDEVSLGMRIQRGLRDGEHLAFEPSVKLRRRMDVGGGLDKRRASPSGFFHRYMTFVHRIVGRYHRARVIALYPLYLLFGWVYVMDWLWGESIAHGTTGRRLLGTLRFTALLPVLAVRELIGARLGPAAGACATLPAAAVEHPG